MFWKRIAPLIATAIVTQVCLAQTATPQQKTKSAKSPQPIELAGCVYSISDCTVLVTSDKRMFHFVGDDDETKKAIGAKTVVRVTAENAEWPSGDACEQNGVSAIRVVKAEVTKMRCQKESPVAYPGATKSPCRDWNAWQDRMPGAKPTLHVTGSCTFPTGGYKVTLTRAVPQGLNPQILILDRKIVKPVGTVNQMVTTEKVTFTEQTTNVYTDVQIRPDNVTIPVKVTQ